MADTIITLIEQAIMANDDEVSLACLRKARKIYQGNGSIVMPQRVIKQASEKGMVPLSEMDAKLAVLQETLTKVNADNQKLTATNHEHAATVLLDGIKADQSLTDKTGAKIKLANRRAMAAWIITAAASVLLIVVL
jgi:hypothetical protein